MAKKNNDNSDFMSRRQDEQLEQLEERLTALYANAENEIRSKWSDFTAGFEKDDEAKRKQVEAGALPEDEYTAWRKTQILKSNQYSKAVESMTNILVETDEAAMATVNGQLPQVVAESYDFVQALGFKAADTAGITTGTFQIYNARTVQALIKDNPDLMPAPKVNIPEDKKWNKDRINREITQGIVQGESITKIAHRLQQVTTMDRNAAVRNARTAMTGAENLGRYESAQDLRENGIPVEEVWSATYDNRTRESHLLLDGTKRDESGYFGVGIINTPLRFAGDPTGDPEEVYNCRCRTGILLQGIDHSQDRDLYEEFMKQFEDGRDMLEGKEPEAESQHQETEQKTAEEIKAPEPIATSRSEELPELKDLEPAEHLTSGSREIVQGEDITDTWSRREDKFEYEIDDVIDAQGFNGLPRVVDEEEFNKAVEESSFIAQRAYSAPDQETLDAYKNALYNGDWYVNCETGGAAYGQGMYAAGNTTGRMNQSIENEMKYYTENSFGDFNRVETMTVTSDFKTIDYKEIKPEFFFKEIENKYAEDQELMAAVEKGRQQRAEGVRGNPFYKDIQSSVKEKYGEEAYAELREFYETNIGFDSITDEGVMATLLGYDGILTHSVTPNISSQVNAEESQHIVILNRTKVIFKRDET